MFTHVKLLTDRKETFIIPVEFILSKGDYLHFKKQGFERRFGARVFAFLMVWFIVGLGENTKFLNVSVG